MAHKLELAAMSRRDGYLFISMRCPDCPQSRFGSKLEDTFGGDHDAEAIAALNAVASVQLHHDYDTRGKQ
jgi:hypothetical protein